MPNQPGKPQNHFEVAQGHDLTGEGLSMHAMNAHAGSEVMGDRPGSRQTAVYQFYGDGVGVEGGLQVVLFQDGGVQKAVRRARIDQRLHGNGRLARDDKVNQEAQVVR